MLVIAGAAHAVDGVVEINQAAAVAGSVTPGDGPGFPVSLNAAGSYRLTGNLEVDVDQAAILINVADVTLDLNGFTLTSMSMTAGSGVFVAAAGHNAQVSNGTIRGFPANGIFVTAGVLRIRALNLRVIDNGSAGLVTQAESSMIKGCTVADNGGYGIRGFAGSMILENVVYNNTQEGLILNSSAYGSNMVYDNNGGNENTQVNQSFSVQLTANQCGDSACP